MLTWDWKHQVAEVSVGGGGGLPRQGPGELAESPLACFLHEQSRGDLSTGIQQPGSPGIVPSVSPAPSRRTAWMALDKEGVPSQKPRATPSQGRGSGTLVRQPMPRGSDKKDPTGPTRAHGTVQTADP